MSQSLLLINFNKFGDSLLQTQLINGLKGKFPQARIGVICSMQCHDVLLHNPKVDYLYLNKVLPEQSPLAFLNYLRQCQRLVFENQVDTIICDKTNSTPITALLLNLLRVKNKIFTGPNRLAVYDLITLRLDRVAKDLSPDAPIIEYNQQILKRLGINTPANVEIFPSTQEMDAADKATKDFSKFICVAPFSSQNATSWPEQNLIDFLNLARNKFHLIVIGNAKEISGLNSKLEATPSLRLITPSSIREAYAIAKKSHLLITLDSAPAHFLQALSIPVLKLNSDRIPPETWGYGDDPKYHFIQKRVPCGPCYSSICFTKGHPCMSEISGEEVLKLISIMTHAK